MRRSKRPSNGVLALMLVIIFTILLFLFEWLGSEQSANWVEKPVAMPQKGAQTEKSKE